MRSETLTKDEKHTLAKLLKELKLVPPDSRPGRLIVELSPDHGIGAIDVITTYR